MRRLTAALATAALCACADAAAIRHSTEVAVSPNAATEWKPPPAAIPAVPPQPPIEIPAELQKPGAAITLDRVVDIALRNNPDTRAAWLAAQAAAAEVGSKRSSYLPEIDLGAQLGRQRQSIAGRINPPLTSWGPSVSLTWLLFDFGGRVSQVEQAREALIAADFEHNTAIQDVVLRVAQAYYGYLDAKALLAAQDATVREQQANYDAAVARHEAGVATIADVLQAKTALSQSELAFESVAGSVQTIQGALATAAGLPATVSLNVGLLPPEVPGASVDQNIEELIDLARARRPDLLAARALAQRAHAHVTEIRSEGLPTLSGASSANRALYPGGSFESANSYAASLIVRFPAFTGFRNTFDIRQAQAEAESSDARAVSLQQQIDLQVWTSYYTLKTAARRLGVARDLLASATESEKVASGRYKEGVGSILDLLSAQAALESARAQEIAARGDWFLSLAQLAHDVGTLDLTEVVAAPRTENK